LKFLVVSLDDKVHNYCLDHGFYSYRMRSGKRTAEELSWWGSPAFNTITKKKKAIVTEILKLGYDVLFSDIDVLFLKDPWRYLRYPGVDYIHSVNARCKRFSLAVSLITCSS